MSNSSLLIHILNGAELLAAHGDAGQRGFGGEEGHIRLSQLERPHLAMVIQQRDARLFQRDPRSSIPGKVPLHARRRNPRSAGRGPRAPACSPTLRPRVPHPSRIRQQRGIERLRQQRLRHLQHFLRDERRNAQVCWPTSWKRVSRLHRFHQAFEHRCDSAVNVLLYSNTASMISDSFSGWPCSTM